MKKIFFPPTKFLLVSETEEQQIKMGTSERVTETNPNNPPLFFYSKQIKNGSFPFPPSHSIHVTYLAVVHFFLGSVSTVETSVFTDSDRLLSVLFFVFLFLIGQVKILGIFIP